MENKGLDFNEELITEENVKLRNEIEMQKKEIKYLNQEISDREADAKEKNKVEEDSKLDKIFEGYEGEREKIDPWKDLNNQYRYGEFDHREEKYINHKKICDSLNELYISKNKEYGDSFGEAYEEIGIMSSVIEIYHKTKRLVNICKNNKEVKYESVEDTLRDLANYAIMTLNEIEMDK